MSPTPAREPEGAPRNKLLLFDRDGARAIPYSRMPRDKLRRELFHLARLATAYEGDGLHEPARELRREARRIERWAETRAPVARARPPRARARAPRPRAPRARRARRQARQTARGDPAEPPPPPAPRGQRAAALEQRERGRT